MKSPMHKTHYLLLLFLLYAPACSNESQHGENTSLTELVFADRSSAEEEKAEAPTAKEAASKDGKTWKRSDKTANMGALFIGDTEQLPLKGSQIAIKIDGFRARVLIDCFFYSDREGQLEGTFKMKLPQGASPYYFAFGESVYLNEDGTPSASLPFVDVDKHTFSIDEIKELRAGAWTAPKVARVVPKEKAAFAYTQTVRRSIDPALAEWAGADIYNCRVFPLLPKKLHRIVMGYDVNLTSLENDWIFDFQIPEVDCPLVVDVDYVKINGVQSAVSPKVKLQKRTNRQYFRLENPTEKSISIRYKSMKNVALITPNQSDLNPYVAYSLSPNLTTSISSNQNRHAVIALDVSLSSNPDRFNVWLKLAEALLANNRQQIKTFNVLCFNIESRWWKPSPVANSAANLQEFLAYANTLALEGATDLHSALSIISQSTVNQASNIFLLSDGADTWGEGDSYAMVSRMNSADRLFAFNTGMSGTSLDKLNHLTRASGGALFSVTGEDEIAPASTAFRATPWKIEKIEAEGHEDLLLAGRAHYLYPGQKLLLTGRGTATKGNQVTLHLSQNGKKQVIPITIHKAIPSSLTRRIYGQYATETLEEFKDATTPAAIAYARHFAVPGKNCSLLMLETEADYKQYKTGATGDLEFIQSNAVNSIVDQLLARIEQLLGDPKQQFKTWLTKLSKMDGMTFTASPNLLAMVDQLPSTTFTISQNSILSQAHQKESLSDSFRKALLASNLDYDVFNQEAKYRLGKYGAVDALKALSSLVEKSPENAVLTRDVAYSALDWNMNDQAYFLFKRVLKSRPYEPQTYLAIAKALAQSGNLELACLYYEVAITTKWDERFGEFRRIATLDYLNTLRQAKRKKGFALKSMATSRYQELKAEFKEKSVDVMVVISWNTDNTDIDLHVIDPTGEECYYENRETRIGGYLTQDVTQGYGPEMYILPQATSGNYAIKVKYFSSDRNRASTRTKVYASVYKNWGTPQESVENKVVVLADNKEMHEVIKIKVD
ncbi:MAG: hypothetical protein ACPGJS_06805 [Flammeovirgaceae bacterium]